MCMSRLLRREANRQQWWECLEESLGNVWLPGLLSGLQVDQTMFFSPQFKSLRAITLGHLAVCGPGINYY